MYSAQKLIEIAIAELGYMEKETNSSLDNKTANAGDNNWTKYARDLHTAGYYQAPKNGYAWCDMFVDWCFLQLAGSKEKGEYLECQTGLYGAGCEWSSDCYRRAGRFDKNPKPGDQIFFGKTDAEEHTGIVEKIEGGYVHTIEGNTSNKVARRKYALTSSYIVGYGHPRFDAETETPSTPETPTTTQLKVGDIVEFTGTKHYASANATNGPTCKPGKAKITRIYQLGKSKHPYHLVAEKGGSTVYGWVDADDIKGASTSQEESATTEWVPKVGDIVQYNGNTHYTSANSTSPKSCRGGKAKITQIYQLGKSKHPYHLVRVSGSGATVYGWVDANSFTKA